LVTHPANPFPHDLWEALQSLRPVAVPCEGKPLFRCSEPSQGIYLVEEGEVRLLFSADPKRQRKFGVAGSGSVLGLSEALTGGDYRLTAEAAEGARISYIDRDTFLRHLSNNHELCLRVVRWLSEDLHHLYDRCRSTPRGTQSGEGFAVPVN
jgi:CRP-like cAMP-binding protein